MKKKILAIALSLAMVAATFSGCGKAPESAAPAPASTEVKAEDGATSETAASYEFDIKVWCPELAVELTQKQIDDFNASNTEGVKLNATIEACSEADSATQMITDVEAGPDLYFFAQDQLSRLIMAGALAQLDDVSADFVRANNDAGSVSACAAGDKLYGFPITSDNGYYMFYNKEYVNEEHLGSMEDLLADCEANGHPFCFSLENGWYNAGFFFATGCESTWETDNDGNFVSINDTFNSDKGLIAAKGMYKMVSSPAWVGADGDKVTQFEAAIPAAIVVSGPWDNVTAKEILGDNLGAAELPSFTVDGQSYHLNSFCGNKLIGMKPQADAEKAACIAMLAEYLSSEACQMERFNELEWGPSNVTAAANEAVQSNAGLAALAAQAPYARPQGNISGAWWDIAKAITPAVKDSAGTDEELKTILEDYAAKCAATITMTSDEKEAWSVIGAINGTSWDTDFAMTRTAEAGTETYISNDAFALHAGETFKVRQGASWDVNFGDPNSGDKDGNCVVAEDGTYFVKLVYDKTAGTGVVTLEKTSFNAWSVIGMVNGTAWDTDFEMEIQDDGTTFKLEGVEVLAGQGLKVRKSHAWDECYGDPNSGDPDGNFLPEADGTVTVVFDSLTGTVTVE